GLIATELADTPQLSGSTLSRLVHEKVDFFSSYGGEGEQGAGALGRELDGDASQSHAGKMPGRVEALDTAPKRYCGWLGCHLKKFLSMAFFMVSSSGRKASH